MQRTADRGFAELTLNHRPTVPCSTRFSVRKQNNWRSGFTLLEIMIVVSIIVILLGLAISKMGNPTAFAKDTAVRDGCVTPPIII